MPFACWENDCTRTLANDGSQGQWPHCRQNVCYLPPLGNKSFISIYRQAIAIEIIFFLPKYELVMNFEKYQVNDPQVTRLPFNQDNVHP